ncbi:MAG TPA: DUF3352 domain-containing protein [Solirubrobacterales bacterium]|nr:DUF3352 domain-containing protein [Solirubrobacterales bacterium]
MKVRLVPPALALTAALAIAGCGASAGGDSGGTDPASAAPPKSPLYIEAAVQPEGELKSNVEALAQSIAGVDDLGDFIASELEESANDSGEPFDYEKEVSPWIGEKAGLFFERYDGDDFSGYGVAVQTTDVGATQAFIDDQAKSSDGPARDGSYEDIDYKVERDDGMTIGIVEGLLVFAEDERTFKDAVDATGGESLADADNFASTVDAAAEGSFADVFVDVGALIDQSGGSIDPEAKQFLDSAGIDPAEATAVASLIPGSDQIEIELSSDLAGENPPSGDASSLLGSLPADSVAAVAAADFGARFDEALDQIDANGIPGEIPPRRFKSTLKEAGIDVDKIVASIGDLGVFAEGSSESSLAGAAVLTMKGSKEATNTVSNIGFLLRASGTPGVTAISGEASGFSVRSDDLGPKPLVVAAQDERIAIAYGLPAARQALASGGGETLADNPTYKEAVSALGGTPISGFVDGPAALKLASALIPADDKEDFLEAKPYLRKIDYVAIGTGSSGDLATAKLIAGIGK